jgi:hypothetical protein
MSKQQIAKPINKSEKHLIFHEYIQYAESLEKPLDITEWIVEKLIETRIELRNLKCQKIRNLKRQKK